ncbi:MAG: carboxymuconolactone decarboxylase family protein [Nitrososphaerota archaeon]|nr:carboxymuconolactone decarboxylase family protein [Nitrososphaerota archaeon]MDG7024543.1 carboxymuconolactone decarboxylase family protein [Nitrososphaerota archaeon]
MRVLPRLEPIEEPEGFMMRIAYWGMKRQMGKVMTPVKVLTARMPGSLKFTNEIVKFETKKIRLRPELHYLIAALAARVNGCSFCTDLARSMVIRDNIDPKKLDALSEYRTDPTFSPRERSALAYVEEATRSKRVSDATFEELRKHFEDWEIAEITWVNAVENYYNLINIPLEIGSDGFCALVPARKKSAQVSPH